MLVQTQNGQIICNMDYLLSIRIEEKVGMSLLTAIPLTDLHTNRWQVSGQKDIT